MQSDKKILYSPGDLAKADRLHCCIFAVICFGFMFAMLGLSAVPVGDVKFDLIPATGTFNVTFPTVSSHFPNSKKALVEYVDGVAVRELGFNTTTNSYSIRQPLGRALSNFRSGDSHFTPYSPGKYRPYTPGLKINLVGKFYLPTYEWKVVPEEMPLLWISPMWCFLSGLVVLLASANRKRELLLNGLVFVGISASLVLIASHRVVELTYLCRTCNGMISDTDSLSHGKLGKLLDGITDPDDFADNNCPSTLQMKCEKGTGVYLFGSVVLLVCMYVMFITIEYKRHDLGVNKGKGLASQDSAQS